MWPRQDVEGPGWSPGTLTASRSAPAPSCYFTYARRGPTCARYSISFIIQVTLTRVVLLTGGMSRTRRCAHWGQDCKGKDHHSSCIVVRRVEIPLKHLLKTLACYCVSKVSPHSGRRMGGFTKVLPSLEILRFRVYSFILRHYFCNVSQIKMQPIKTLYCKIC